jgi:probable phosphoglycerate mutase
MSDRRIVLWRHGRTEWNANARFQGQLDVELDDVGRAQAKRAAPLLAQMNPARIVSSDLSRARETAGALAAETGLEVVTDPAFRETYSGQWEGLERHEIQAQFAASWAAWIEGEDLVRPGGDGELRGEVADRFVAGLMPYVDTLADGQTLVVATHGGSARAAIARLMGLPETHWPSLGVLSNCAWSVLVERPASQFWRLIEYNAGSLPEPPLSDDR